MKTVKKKDNIIQITKTGVPESKAGSGIILSLFFALVITAQICAPVIAAAIRNCEALDNVSVWVGAASAIIVSIVILLLFKLLLQKTKPGFWIFGGAGILLPAVFALLFRKAFLSGGTIYLNAILFNWNLKKGDLVYYYEFDAAAGTLHLCIFLCFAVIAFVSLTELLLYYRRRIELLILLFIVFVGSWIALPTAPLWPGIATGVSLLLFILYSDTEKSLFRGKKRYLFGVIGGMIAVTAFVFLLGSLLPGKWIGNLQSGLVSAIEDTHYGKSDLTNGNLKQAKKRNTSKKERLQLSITPQDDAAEEDLKDHMAYLRGFVGSFYTGSRWTDLDEAAYQDTATAANLSMFQWLTESNLDKNETQFLPIASSAAALHLASTYDDRSYALEQYEYQITNIGASDQYLYLPGAFTESFINGNKEQTSITVEQMNKDINIRNSLLSKVNSYGAFTRELDIDDYIYLTDNNALMDERFIQQNAAFIQREQNYSDYVDQCYNYGVTTSGSRKYYSGETLTDEVLEYFDGTTAIMGKGRGNVSDIIWDVREYLEKNMTYSDKPKSTFGTRKAASDDYVVNLLTKDKEGYSVQYATVATLMFRYYGIPARYVEGYLAKGNQEMVTAKDAHAWVEIYRYGFGWVPVDVTPGYYDVPDERLLLQRQRKNEESGQPTDPNEGEDEGGSDQDGGGGSSLRGLIWLWILLAILAVVFAFLIRRWFVLWNRKKKIHSDDQKNNLQQISRLILKNASLAQINLRKDFSRSEADKMNSLTGLQQRVRYEDVSDAVAHALYSKDGAQKKDVETMEQYWKETIKAIYEPAGSFKKLKLKYINLVC